MKKASPYSTPYYDDAWLKAQGFELAPLIEAVAACAERGEPLPGELLTEGLE